MKKGINLSRRQDVVLVVAGLAAVMGIHVFLATPVDTTAPLVIGVDLVICAVTIWAPRRFVASSVDKNGRLIRRKKTDFRSRRKLSAA